MLEVGGDIGALVLYVPAELLGAEIDLEPLDAALVHTHSAVRERRLGETRRYAAVYPQLHAGLYLVGGSEQEVVIEGGRITEVAYTATGVRTGVGHHGPGRG